MGCGATPTVPWDKMKVEAGEGRGKNLFMLHPIPKPPRILAFESFATTAYAVDREQ